MTAPAQGGPRSGREARPMQAAPESDAPGKAASGSSPMADVEVAEMVDRLRQVTAQTKTENAMKRWTEVDQRGKPRTLQAHAFLYGLLETLSLWVSVAAAAPIAMLFVSGWPFWFGLGYTVLYAIVLAPALHLVTAALRAAFSIAMGQEPATWLVQLLASPPTEMMLAEEQRANPWGYYWRATSLRLNPLSNLANMLLLAAVRARPSAGRAVLYAVKQECSSPNKAAQRVSVTMETSRYVTRMPRILAVELRVMLATAFTGLTSLRSLFDISSPKSGTV